MSTNLLQNTSSVKNISNPLSWQQIFIDEYRKSKSVYRAAQAAGVSRPTVYKYLRIDPSFKEEYDSAHQDAIDSLEYSAFQRARDGVQTITPIHYKGQHIADKIETKYSDALAEFFLKHNRPEVYNPAQVINHTITIDQTERKTMITQAVQNGLNMGMSLQDTLSYLTMRGVSPDDLQLVSGSDLQFPDTSNAIDVTCESDEK